MLMYLVLEHTDSDWRWTVYSAYHRPVAESERAFASREACLDDAQDARRGAPSLPVRERPLRRLPRPEWPAEAVDRG